MDRWLNEINKRTKASDLKHKYDAFFIDLWGVHT